MDQSDIDALMEQNRQPAIMLHRFYPPGKIPEANSCLGGLPALPPGTDWPRTGKGVPMHFLAQIDCAELPPNGGVLPGEGVLFFFARIDDEMDWGYDDPQGAGRVIFAPAAGNSRVPAPDGLPSIQGGHGAYERDFVLPGEAPFTVYPRWPVVGLPIQSWPDYEAFPNHWEKDLGDYQNSVFRGRAAEAARATGLPVKTGIEPNWGNDPSVHRSDAAARLPSDEERPFPQAWVMVDRIARYLANNVREKRERELNKGPGAPSYNDPARLQVIYDASAKWTEAAAIGGLGTALGDEGCRLFNDWLTALAKDDSADIRFSVGIAIGEGMYSAIQFAADSAQAAALIPPRYFDELKERNMAIGSSCHQMLGNAGSSQEARSVERDEVLLLHLISDYGVNFMFCDVGEAEFWINRKDLAARRFDKVSATTCGG